MSEKDVTITADGMRRRTSRGKKRAQQQKRAKARARAAESARRDESSKKFGRGTKYKKCREAIREAADRGEEYVRFTFSDFRSLGGGTVGGVSEALATKLKKNGFKATVIYPKTESVNMGDSAAPCMIDITSGGVEVSWGSGEGHNKPEERRRW